MLSFILGAFLYEKVAYLLVKERNFDEEKAVKYLREAPVNDIAKEIEGIFRVEYKEALHYAEIVKSELSSDTKRKGESFYFPNVIYTGCGSTVQYWQWGNDNTIPAGCGGTDRCWGTVLGGNYANNMNDTLYSPIINTVGYSVLRLQFQHFYDTENNYDYGRVLCSSDGGATWTLIAQYTGNSGSWLNANLDISVCGNSPNTRIAFVFYSDGSVTYRGWYIDSVVVSGQNVTSSAVLYSSSFEGSNGDLVVQNIGGVAPWQRGVPTSGPSSAYHGTEVWATNLVGDYNNNANQAIRKNASINLTGYTSYRLRFYHWYSIETGWDTGFVEVSTDGGSTWNTIATYSGHNTTWNLQIFDISAYSSANFTFRFRFKSDGSVVYPGWYIDSVSIVGQNLSPPTNLALYNFNANDGGFTATQRTLAPEPYSITNNFMEWWFDIQTTNDFGTYTARTGPSHTYPNVSILYGAQLSPPSVWSSWTTIHSLNTNTDYIGKNGTATPPPGFTYQNLKNYAYQVICEPSIPRITFVYNILNGADSLTVKEIFHITGSSSSDTRLWHKTVVKNNRTSGCAYVGIRWEYDTHVGAEDNPAHYRCDYFPSFSLNCHTYVTNSVQVGPPIPTNFDLLRESNTNPPTGAYHLFAVYYDGTSVSVPDFVYHDRWGNAHNNTWTYGLAGDNISLETGYDNAFVYFFNPVCINPGDSIVRESFIGSLDSPTDSDGELGIGERVIREGSLIGENVKIYDVVGREVKDRRLRRGIYFLKEDGKVYKVIVR